MNPVDQQTLALIGDGYAAAWGETEQIALELLALVDEQRKALDRLLPYSDHLRTCAITGKRPPGVCTCGYLDALAGSPAENLEEA